MGGQKTARKVLRMFEWPLKCYIFNVISTISVCNSVVLKSKILPIMNLKIKKKSRKNWGSLKSSLGCPGLEFLNLALSRTLFSFRSWQVGIKSNNIHRCDGHSDCQPRYVNDVAQLGWNKLVRRVNARLHSGLQNEYQYKRVRHRWEELLCWNRKFFKYYLSANQYLTYLALELIIFIQNRTKQNQLNFLHLETNLCF